MSSEKHIGEFIPLLVFTALLIIAAGIVIGVAAAYAVLPGWWELDLPLLVIALVLIVFGGLTSFLHLGRKGRAALAASGISHSWLSREAVLSGLFAAAAAGAIFSRVFIRSESVYSATLALAAVLGFFTTISVGKLYDLSAQAGWRGPARSLTPPVSALLLGGALFCGLPEEAMWAWLFYGLWLADVVLLGWRDSEHRRNIRENAAFAFPALSQAAKYLYNIRKLLSIVVLVFFIMNNAQNAAETIAFAIVLDRICLYFASAQSTPTSEMRKLKAERMEQAAG